jgi:hypothetical protein
VVVVVVKAIQFTRAMKASTVVVMEVVEEVWFSVQQTLAVQAGEL